MMSGCLAWSLLCSCFWLYLNWMAHCSSIRSRLFILRTLPFCSERVSFLQKTVQKTRGLYLSTHRPERNRRRVVKKSDRPSAIAMSLGSEGHVASTQTSGLFQLPMTLKCTKRLTPQVDRLFQFVAHETIDAPEFWD